jgi:hypothetical protein
MQLSGTIECPYCGQDCEIAIESEVRSQQFTTDCQICCRPFLVKVECDPGEILSLDASVE